MKYIGYLLFVLIYSVIAFKPGQKYSAVYDSNKSTWSVQEGDQGVAWGLLKQHDHETGWEVLNVVTDGSQDDELQAYAAGYIEGVLTQHLIAYAWQSFIESQQISEEVYTFAMHNDKWVRSMVKNPPSNQVDYWTHVGLVLQQFDGLLAGYNDYATNKLTQNQFLVYQLSWEIGDISAGLNVSKKRQLPFMQDAHCSVLIKPSPDGNQLLASHVTWTGYEDMLRIFKHYTTNFQLDSNKAKTASFSSFPGNLPSGDDWYITSSNLVVVETTNGVMNNSLYWNFITEQSVMYWVRVIVANRMASNGQEWTNYFSLYNSGTYNNQWMVVDYKLFTPGKPLQPGTLWVAEQIPGYVVSADQTDVILKTGYWASYNIPYYPFIYNISDYPSYEQKYGDSYSYSKCARAQIFRRDQKQVANLDDLKKIMRYNEWQTDPLSLKDACRGISARCDLNAPWTQNSLNGYAAFGAIDCKVTDNLLVPKIQTEAISGPTWQSQPPFAWTEQWSHVPHYGQPKVFAFDFESMVPEK